MKTHNLSGPSARRALPWLAAAMITCLPSHAGIVSQDNFDSYTSGAALNSLNGGSGWSGAWTAVSGVSVSSEAISLTLGTNSTGGGNSLKIAANAESTLSRSITPAAEGLDMYVGFIFQVKGGTVDTPVAGNVFTGWQALDADANAANDNVGYLGLSGKAGARVKNTSTSFDTALLYGRTYLYIIKYTDWDGTAYQTTQVWLNPASVADEFTTNNAITRTQTIAGGGSSGFHGLRTRTVGLGASNYYLVDEVRIGTTWDSVAAFPLTMAADGNWAPYAHSLAITPGGIFDFSKLLDAPAGKHGAIRATPEGHFEFLNRPGVRSRFWGVNLCFSANYLTQANADLVAERLARSGYNTVRLHHFDGDLVPAGANSWTLDSAKLAQLDYLFHALKLRGIYINIDLYSDRKFSAAEAASFGVPLSKADSLFKGLVPIDPDALNSWKLFANNLLNHVNPYTGLTWGNDPALIGICPVNEDPLHRQLGDPDLKARYDAAFDAVHVPPPGETPAQRTTAYNQFIFETNAASDAAMFAHLRSLNVKALLTGANYTIATGLVSVRQHYDYVDNHIYWDHPEFPGTAWALPIAFDQTSSTASRAYVPSRVMASRIFGRPFTLTEFHFSRPNHYRAEGAVLMPAYSSLQDWDGLYNFHYSTDSATIVNGGADNYFAVANDPITLIGDRVGSLVFQRGDVAPAPTAVVWAARPSEAFSGTLGKEFGGDFRPLGLITRIGSLPGEPADVLAANPDITAAVIGTTLSPMPAGTYLSTASMVSNMVNGGALPAGTSTAGGIYTSETGQIQLSSTEKTVKVVTPASEMFMLAPGSQLMGDRIAVTNGQTLGAVSVVALETSAAESPSLSNARRILVTHLTDSLPTGMKFSNTSKTLMEKWGSSPHLVRGGYADLSLSLPTGTWKAWAVDATGVRTREVALTEVEPDLWSLAVETVDANGNTQLAYELAKSDYTGWNFTTASRASLGSAGWSGWGAQGTATATTFTTTSLSFSNTNPRLGLLNGTGTGEGLGAVFAHTGSSATESARNDRFVLTTPVSPLSVTGAGQLTLAWDQAFNSPSTTSSKVLVKAGGLWYASAGQYTVTAATNSAAMTNVVTCTLNLAGSAGLGTTQWYPITFGNGQPIIQNASPVSSPIGTTLEGLGFLVQTGSAASRVAFVDNVRLVFGTVP